MNKKKKNLDVFGIDGYYYIDVIWVVLSHGTCAYIWPEAALLRRLLRLFRILLNAAFLRRPVAATCIKLHINIPPEPLFWISINVDFD